MVWSVKLGSTAGAQLKHDTKANRSRRVIVTLTVLLALSVLNSIKLITSCMLPYLKDIPIEAVGIIESAMALQHIGNTASKMNLFNSFARKTRCKTNHLQVNILGNLEKSNGISQRTFAAKIQTAPRKKVCSQSASILPCQ